MDILKTLTRSTKLSSRNLSAQQSSLPSSGTNLNPQLFHDQGLAQARGKKRKRAGEAKNGNPAAADETEDVDFFAPKAPPKKTKQGDLLSKQRSHTENDDKLDLQTPQILDDVECRRILHSHRLKVTLLPSATQPKSKQKKSKRRENMGEKESKQGKYERLFPQPLTDFAGLRAAYGVSGRLNDNIANQGFKLPTEVQMASLPLLLRPKFALRDQLRNESDAEETPHIDLLAVAPTGSGKTMAFLIPIINSQLEHKRTANSDGVQAIVVAPTKELASQIVNEGRKLCIGTGIKVIGMKKGMRVVHLGDKTDTAKSAEGSSEESGDEGKETSPNRSIQPVTKADILITTPLTLLHALSHATDSEGLPLPSVRHLVLDEADVLLDSLFREQTLGIWKACNNPDLRVTLWSATMGSNIEAIALDAINARKERLGVSTGSIIIRLVVGLKDTAIPNITQRLVYAATESGKLIALRQLLHPTAKSASSEQALRPPFLVFTQTIPRAVALHSELQYDIPAEAGGSSRMAVLHSELSDSAREQIMTRFRNGEIWVLITTDILSRGVDFKGINGVVNYDIPNSAASYIHRVGRTGRAGRNGGMAVTYYTKEDLPYVKNIANIIAATEKQAGKTDSESGIQKWLLAALPTPSKEEKKALKQQGVEARRPGRAEGGVNAKMRISTKSAFGRRQENNRKGAIEASRRRRSIIAVEQLDEDAEGKDDGGEWSGFDSE